MNEPIEQFVVKVSEVSDSVFAGIVFNRNMRPTGDGVATFQRPNFEISVGDELFLTTQFAARPRGMFHWSMARKAWPAT